MKEILKSFKKRDWLLIIISLALIVTQVWVDLKLPEFTVNITKLFNQTTTKVSKVLVQGGYLLLYSLMSVALSVLVGLLASIIAGRLSKNLRSKLFNKIQSYSMNEIKKFSVASLITRSTNDIRQIQYFVAMGLQVLIKAPVMAVWGICKLVGKSWEISLATFIGVIVISLALVLIMTFAIPRFKKIQKLLDNLNNVTRENLTGVKVVRAFNAEDYESKRFEKANLNIAQNDVEVHRIMGLLSPIMNIVMNCLTLTVYCIVAVLVNKANLFGKFEIMSNIWLYTSWTMNIVSAFMMIIMISMMLPRVLVSISRVREVLKTETSIKDGNGVKTEIKGVVEFKDVNFKYPDTNKDCLKNIAFKCNQGDVVAIIGATGSGKSSLINLIPRFYDVSSGEVLVNGKNVKDYKLTDLYDKIGYISQKAVLLKGKIKDNISLGLIKGEKPTEEDINHALNISQATDFVSNLEEGVDYEISQGATNVSGGQKQRLSIARAISRKPEILIFDDSFSALDYKTDKNLRAMLKSELKDTTCFIVAQRIGTIKNADLIIVLENGEIVGMGKHKELINNCDVYKEVALSQLDKEELDVK